MGNFVNGFGTFNLYSLSEVLGGVAMFLGFLSLGVAAVWGWLHTRKNPVMTIYLILAMAMFIFSWVDYQPNVFAPPRLTFYFLVPLIYYASTWVNIKSLAIICVLAVAASWAGCPTMLYTGNTLTLEEYDFLDSLPVDVHGIAEWWTDYPFRVALTSYYNAEPTVALNVATVESLSAGILDVESTLRNDTGYRYVLVSPRMEKEGLFFIHTDSRTIHIRKPVSDIWVDSPNWRLIKELNGIKLYERILK